MRLPPHTPRRPAPPLVGALVAALLLAVGALRAAPPASARGGDGEAIVVRKLLEKGLAHLHRAESHYMKSEHAEARRQGDAAQRVFLDVLSQDPGNTTAVLFGGQAASFGGDLKAATTWLERFGRISRLGSHDPDLHFLNAFIAVIAADRPAAGISSLKKMYSVNPRRRAGERDALWFRALTNLSRKLLAAAKYDEAIKQLRAGRRLARRMGNRTGEKMMMANEGVALMRDKRFIEAAEIYQKLIAADPRNPVWHWQLGLVNADQSKFAEAVLNYREVMRLRDAGISPTSFESEIRKVHLRIGNCLRLLAYRYRDPKQRAASFTEAEKEIRKYIEIAPKDALGHKWLGVHLFQDREKPYEALPHFKTAFKLDPECSDSLVYMLQIHTKYPPPPEQLPEDDPETAARNRERWEAVIKPWTKNLEDNAERRQKVLEARADKTGSDGCG